MMTAKEFVRKAHEAASKKTLYVNGAFGAPATTYNKARYTNALNKNRIEAINDADEDTFFFDCVCLIKGILWGWNADPIARNGGAIYVSNGVPDVGEDSMIAMCPNSTHDFEGIVPGAMLWIPGHAGIYIGRGLAIEATAAWGSKVQITAVRNILETDKLPGRMWMRWGKLPWVDYTGEDDMTYDKFCEYMKRYEKEQKSLPAHEWAKDSLEWAKTEGLIVGDESGNQMPQSPLSTERAAVILKAAVDKYGNK